MVLDDSNHRRRREPALERVSAARSADAAPSTSRPPRLTAAVREFAGGRWTAAEGILTALFERLRPLVSAVTMQTLKNLHCSMETHSGIHRLRGGLQTVAGVAMLAILLAPLGRAEAQQIRTLEPGVLTVAVTTEAPTSPYDPQLWIRRYVERFAAEQGLDINWVVVPFNESWLLAGDGIVDLVATNVASFPDRQSAGGTFSAPFLYERRALRIHPEDEGRYAHINDFIGRTVGVVTGMAAERDVDRRAPAGVIVKRAGTFDQLYDEFDAGELDAIAEAEYYSLDDQVIPSHGDEVILIDHHDLTPGQREESVFVVRDESENLLAAVNAFIARTEFPLSE